MSVSTCTRPSCALLGCVAWVGPDELEWRLPRAARPAIALHLAAAALAAAGFLHLAHLGYENEDPDIGAFRSYFTSAELASLRDARAAEWVVSPPGELRPMGLEDYFRSEAGWHVRHRNRALAAGDFYVAAKENEILEKYYAPFLELPNAAGDPFALNPDERRRTEAGRPAADPYPYRSSVFRDPLRMRIWTVPSKRVLWASTLAVCLFLLWSAGSGSRRSRSPDQGSRCRRCGSDW